MVQVAPERILEPGIGVSQAADRVLDMGTHAGR